MCFQECPVHREREVQGAILSLSLAFLCLCCKGLSVSYKRKQSQKNMDEKQTNVHKLMTALSQKYQDQSNVSFANTGPPGEEGYRTLAFVEIIVAGECG